jgi:hypothetical protein
VRADAASIDGSFSAALLKPEQGLPFVISAKAQKRYAVYRNNVTVGLVRALEANFPAVRQLLGTEYFAGLAGAFVRIHPPKSPLMFFYSAEFSGYLTEQDDLQDFPYLADVAQLEQQWRHSYHAADATVLSPAELVDDALDELRLIPHPSFALITSVYALHAIFSSARGQADETPFDPAQRQTVLVTRPAFDVMTRLIKDSEAEFFNALANGATLGTAAEQALCVDNNFDLSATIAMMMQAGAFQSLNQKAQS